MTAGGPLAPFPPPRVSVVIPTRNRRAELEVTLASLRRQTLPFAGFEVVVVVDGSEDDTLQMLAELGPPFALIVLARRRDGRAAAVNAGLRAAHGEIAVILDDDISASEGLLETYDRYLRAHPDHAVVGAAPIAVPPDALAVLRLVGTKMNDHLARLEQPGFRFGERDFYSGNFAIRRASLLELGGYDEDFTLYGNEDCELAHRLIQAGVPIVYLAWAIGHQRYTKTFARLARDTYQKGRTTVLFGRKHPRVVGRLRLEEPPVFSWRTRVLMAGVLAVPRTTGRALDLLFAALGWLDRRCPWFLVPRYQAVLDVLYWLGVREEQGRGKRAADAEAPAVDLHGLVGVARCSGWREAVAREGSRDPELFRYATDPREGDWLLLLRDIAPGRALFLGNALGVLPFLLAAGFPEVVVSDDEAARLEFARLRAAEQGVPVRALPWDAVEADVARSGPFALIAIGDGWAEGDGRAATGRADPVRLGSLLGEGGTLVYAAGRPPSAAGRGLGGSRLATAVRRGREARRLRAARFTDVARYWRRPDHRPYETYVPLTEPGVVEYYLRTAPRGPGIQGRLPRVAARLAARVGILSRLADDLVVIARRS